MPKRLPGVRQRALSDRRRDQRATRILPGQLQGLASTSATSTPARKCDHDGYNPNIASAAKPPQPIDKGLPGPSLLAYVAVSKLGDHLPLYRLEHIFERQKVHMARSTMCAWMRCAGELVAPLVELMIERVRQSRVIHTDDTTVPIQSPGQKQCRKGRIWCYLGDEANPYTVYDYTPSRSPRRPGQVAGGLHGLLASRRLRRLRRDLSRAAA